MSEVTILSVLLGMSVLNVYLIYSLIMLFSIESLRMNMLRPLRRKLTKLSSSKKNLILMFWFMESLRCDSLY